MSGGKQKRSQGYTIVEVMIVLAISGLMFVIAAGFVQGKQESSSFTAGVNSMASTLQDAIEQIVDGKYSDENINCAPGPLFSVPTGQNQGTNQACMYLGKVLHFYGGSSPSRYETFTIAGNRTDLVTGKLVTMQSGANPLSQAVPTPVVSPVDLTVQSTVPQNLDATLYLNSIAPGNQIYAFGLMQGLGQDNGAGGVTIGTQSVSLYYANSLTTSEPANTAGETAAASVIKNNLSPAGAVVICLTDGTQTAAVVVGASNSQLTVYTKWDGRTTTCS